MTAPMPGKIVKVLVKPGDAVAARQGLVVIEAMKMENELRATRAGRVKDVHVAEGDLVDAGRLLDGDRVRLSSLRRRWPEAALIAVARDRGGLHRRWRGGPSRSR